VSPPLADAVRTYKALAHPVRLRLLAMLEGGGLCVCQMTAATGLAPSTVSAHLSDLKSAGLLAERKDGRWVRYAWKETPEARRARVEVRRRLAGDPQLADDARLLRDLRRVGVEALCRVELDLGRLGIRRPSPAVGRP
jgi:arsenate reductase/ArsR family transcriptional regulator